MFANSNMTLQSSGMPCTAVSHLSELETILKWERSIVFPTLFPWPRNYTRPLATSCWLSSRW